MTMVSVKVTTERWDALGAEHTIKVGTVVRKTTLRVERNIKMDMQSQKSGRTYARGGNQHRASAPGEAPAIDYGHLINTIQSQFPMLLLGRVFTNAEYAAALEFGTVNMQPRPFMGKAADAESAQFVRDINDLLK